MKALQLSELNLGCIDAKHELIAPTEMESQRFTNSYLVPDNIIIDQYLNGQYYFVTGLKGTGKTALLKYLAIQSKKQKGAGYRFFLFKSDLSEEDKVNFGKYSNTLLIDKSTDRMPLQDYEVVWRLFFHRFIANVINGGESHIFIPNETLRQYLACAMVPHSNEKQSGLWSLIPKLKKGSIEVNFEFLKLGFELDWADDKKITVTVDSLVRQLDELFKALQPGDHPFYLFVDELELNLGNKSLHTRDAILIRDLVITVCKFNTICKEKRIPITIMAGIRSEVLGAASGFGKEINKPMSDFGNNISWHQKGNDVAGHPLLMMIRKRLIASEEFHGMAEDRDAVAVWNRYFSAELHGGAAQKIILNNTWYRPRDIVRMLTTVQKRYPGQTQFSQELFDATKKQYSTDSWIELTEELSVKYDPDDIYGMKRLLYGYKPYFFARQMRDHARELRVTYKEIRQALDKHDLDEILLDLYKVGIIGNGTKNNIRFAFRGDDELLLEQTIMLHPALIPYFSARIERHPTPPSGDTPNYPASR